jgi:glycine hydroxymethyltransferase
MNNIYVIFKSIRNYEREQERQNNTIELIASENFVSDDVLKAVGSCLTNKYSRVIPQIEIPETVVGITWLPNVDELEEYCCNKWREVFKTDYHVNVQPHSGSSANFADIWQFLIRRYNPCNES